MADARFLTPVSEDDPCGPDLRWDPEVLDLDLGNALAAAVLQDDGTVVGAEIVRSAGMSFEEIVDAATSLSGRTKDIRILVIHAEAIWHSSGLVAFAHAMENLLAVAEAWPGPADGVHPRADENDDDLGERGAALGRLLKQIPTMAATIGWGPADVGTREQVECVTTLKGVFRPWSKRLEPAFGPELPAAMEAWRALQGLVGSVNMSAAALDDDADSNGEPFDTHASPPAFDVWDLIDRALEQIAVQDRHSPARPVLRLLAGWRSLDIVEIAEKMKPSGISLEQLLESVKKQLEPGR